MKYVNRKTPEIQTQQINSFGKFKQDFKKVKSLKTHAKWKKIVYLAIITTYENHTNESNTVTAGENREQQTQADCNVPCEHRGRGCGLDGEVDWNIEFYFSTIM